MAMRKVGIFGAAGVLAAILIIAAVSMSGLKLPGSYNRGTLIVKVMDKPTDLLHLNITIDWAKIKDEDGNWYDLTLKSSPFYFDLLALHNVSETLSETEVPAGNYTAIWMHVLTANATYPDFATDDLNVPSDVIKVLLHPHLRIEGMGSVTVLIDLQPDDLKSIAISRSLNLRPVVKATVPG